MIIYILLNHYNSAYDGEEYNILGVYDSMDKAKEHMKKAYEDDVVWLKEHCEDVEEWDQNDLGETHSCVAGNGYDWWSDNWIEEKLVG